MNALTATDFNFPGQQSVYHGKVRDVYNINGEKLVMVATDRSQVPRCHHRHLPQLENSHPRPYGNRGRNVRRLPG